MRCRFRTAAANFGQRLVIHLLEPQERMLALKEMTRILLPGGRLGLAMPADESGLDQIASALSESGCELFKQKSGMVLAVIP